MPDPVTAAPAESPPAAPIAQTIPDTSPRDYAPRDSSPLTLTQARAMIRERAKEEPKAEQAEQPAPQEQEAAAPDPQDPGEKQTADEPDPAEQPPIETPRSWTPEQKAKFAELPREIQEISLEHEKRRETDFRRVQNEQADARKAAQAEQQQLQQVRQQYEQLLPQMQSMTMDALQRDFADVKTWDDVQRMSTEEPERYFQWHALNQRLEATAAEHQRQQGQRQQEAVQAFNSFASEQDRLASEKIPELADPDKAKGAVKLTTENLVASGFSEDELAAMWAGQSGVSIRDARMQSILYDAARFRAAQKAAKVAAQKPVPHVLRPGTAPNKGIAVAQHINDLSTQLDRTGSLKDAFALLQARKSVASR